MAKVSEKYTQPKSEKPYNVNEKVSDKPKYINVRGAGAATKGKKFLDR